MGRQKCDLDSRKVGAMAEPVFASTVVAPPPSQERSLCAVACSSALNG
jgi:hypothetical protein